jgi:NAD+ diphosphatase
MAERLASGCDGPARGLGGLALSRGTIDRAAYRRSDEALLAAYWSHPETRVLVVSSGQALVLDDPKTGESRLVLSTSYDAPDGERYFLGLDDDGVAYFALATEKLPGRLDSDAHTAGLRQIGAVLSDRDAGLFTHAVALENWHRAHQFCARCGNRTEIASGGHTRRCGNCGAEHYPRTDPAVIMLVTDTEERVLLGHQELWPERRFSILAGFVEPGESLEQAVAREVDEEVRVTVAVGDVRYRGSQPWPFPSSLMLGFTARTEHPETMRVDGTEIHEARWFSREELREAVAKGEVLLPSGVSIARRLIEEWNGAPFAASDPW